MIFLIWMIAVFVVLAIYFNKVYSRFSKYGVKHFKPMPPVGNMGRILLRKSPIFDSLIILYKSFPEERFIGSYSFVTPNLIVRDMDLIKNIVVKDFEYFVDHTSLVDETADPLFGRNLFSLKGEDWKQMRSKLSPAFTSSKMRIMVPFIVDVCNQMIKFVKKSIQDSPENFADIECSDLSSRYAHDVITSYSFGLKVDSHNEQDNEFYKMGMLATNISFKQFVLLTAFNSSPMLMKKFKITIFAQATKNFFKNLVARMMRDREINNVNRPDIINQLIETKKGNITLSNKESKDDIAKVEKTATDKGENRVWSDDDLIAQAVVFFLAGFNTVSTAISFALHEIGVNPDVQERLVQEIKETDAKNNGVFDYNSVQNMKYMDMVVSEILRKWPPVPVLDRTCRKDYNIGKPNKKSPHEYIIRKGEVVKIPACAIHRDPEFYPNPEKFDPERFSESNKHLIKPLTYMPFGLGPRNCVASRFALWECKVMLYQILKHLELSPCEKTCIPEVVDNADLKFRLKGGHWLRFKIRE
ncbi:unnamed protein product [Parnassius mnemosyne]|uniref:unspecific monooxygenase n=1 Tax=Parnassius mnemosyne TaxID=213953 RepID=A0AAV1LR75_9NEOP